MNILYNTNAGRLQILTCAARQTSKQMTSRNDRSSSILLEIFMIYNYVCMCYGLLAVYMYLELDVYQFLGPKLLPSVEVELWGDLRTL